jgi:diguanylate cyclase (GGDEF)-like protein
MATLNAWLETTKSPARFTESGFEREGFADTTPKALKDLPKKDELLQDTETILKEKKVVSLVFIDLDNFKAVNDKLGHQEGDRCLERVVEILSDAVLGKGRLYRYGTGDEFGVLLKNFTKPEALATAERIRREIDMRNPGESIKVTASIGVACSETGDLTSEQLLKLADDAVYKSKKDAS